MIPLNDFKRQWAAIREPAESALRRVGSSGWYILGDEVRGFERKLAERWGLAHAVGVANGMDAIEIALRALGIGPGDKALTTPLTAFATTLAVLRAGATPVFVDVDDEGLVDLALCRAALERDRSIRAFIPVHLYGFCLDPRELARLRSDFGLKLIEDCAQSIGATRSGAACGLVGDCAATSFYPTKNLGALGDGGALLTNDVALAERARVLRHYGQESQYVHSELGLNSRLDELHAAILTDAMLPRLAEWTERRRAIAARYLAGIRNPAIRLPRTPADSRPAWHLFPIQLARGSRDGLQSFLKSRGVTSAVHYPRLVTEQKALTEHGRFEVVGPLQRASRIAASELSLPIHPFLTDEETDSVIEACNAWAP